MRTCPGRESLVEAAEVKGGVRHAKWWSMLPGRKHPGHIYMKTTSLK